MTPTKFRGDKKCLKSDLEFIDYNHEVTDDQTKTLPAKSVSRNLIARLNELSSPVARRLRFWNKKSVQLNQLDPSFKVIYLGNLAIQFWSKDESCLDKPLGTLWNNYLVNMKTEIVMRMTICNSGLKAITRQHGLTQYWWSRLVYCCSHKDHPKVFTWVYRHEGKKMRQELRCHAVLCSSPESSANLASLLNQRLAYALQEFKRERKSRGSSNCGTGSSIATQKLPRTIPLRRQILEKGSTNFRPPLERSKSAPRLTSIQEEDIPDDQVSEDEYMFAQSFGECEDEEDTERSSHNHAKGKQSESDNIDSSESNLSSVLKRLEEATISGDPSKPGDNSFKKSKPPDESNSIVEQSTITLLRTANGYEHINTIGRTDTTTKEILANSAVNDEATMRHENEQRLDRASANMLFQSDNSSQSLGIANHNQGSSKLSQNMIQVSLDGTDKSKSNNTTTNNNNNNNNNTISIELPKTYGQDKNDTSATDEIISSWSSFVIR